MMTKIYQELLNYIENQETTKFIDLITKASVRNCVTFNVSYNNDQLLRQACYRGNIELVDFLLTSPILLDKANIYACENECIVEACSYGYLDIVKFLLTSDKLTEKSNIHTSKDLPFLLAVHEEKIDIIKYLIFDYKIPYTIEIQKILSTPNANNSLVQGLFKKRDMYDNLNLSLQSKPPFNIKNKL